MLRGQRFFLTFDFKFTQFHKIKPNLFISGADNKGFVASESDPATTTAPPAPATTVTVTDESAKAEAPKEEAKEETTEKKEE